MSRQSFTLNGHTLEITREMIDVSSYTPWRDPEWKATDDAGHHHYAVQTGFIVAYPTLAVRHGDQYECGIGDCDEVHVDSWFVCTRCGEKIVPGTITDYSVQRIPGMTSYVLDGEPVPPETAQAFVETWQRQADDRATRRRQPWDADREAGYL